MLVLQSLFSYKITINISWQKLNKHQKRAHILKTDCNSTSMGLASLINTTTLHIRVSPKDPSVCLKLSSFKLKNRIKIPKAKTKLSKILFIGPRSLKLLVEPCTR